MIIFATFWEYFQFLVTQNTDIPRELEFYNFRKIMFLKFTLGIDYLEAYNPGKYSKISKFMRFKTPLEEVSITLSCNSRDINE